MAGFEIPQTNVVISEEETHSAQSFVVYEKAIPKVLNVHDFLKFAEHPADLAKHSLSNDALFAPPYFSISSPPPEA